MKFNQIFSAVLTIAFFSILLSSNSNASVKLTFNAHINIIDNISVSCNDITTPYNITDLYKGIDNEYFSSGRIDIFLNEIIFNNFRNKGNNYDLYIEYNGFSYKNVTLDYQNNPLYIPKLHTRNISRLDISSLSGGDPKGGQIEEIDSYKIFLNQRLLKDYENVIVNLTPTPILFYNILTSVAKGIGDIAGLIFDVYVLDPLNNLYRRSRG